MKCTSRGAQAAVAMVFATLGFADTAKCQRTPAREPKTGREVVERSLAAIGLQALAGHRSLYIRVKQPMLGRPDTVTIETWKVRPDKILTRITAPGFPTTDNRFDGKIGWLKSGPNVRLLNADESAAARTQASWPDDLSAYRAMELLGVESFEGRSCYKVKIVSRDGTEQTRYFDRATGLPAGFRHMVPTARGPQTATVLLRDYREFGGVRMATRIVQRVLETEQSHVIDRVEWDRVAPSIFQASVLADSTR